MESVLDWLRPSLEEVSGLALHPTYSFYRLYKHGDKLDKHHDRPACEISLSLNLGQEPALPWPLWIEGSQGPISVALDPGDALLYRGVACAHWREPLMGRRVAQLFLHYVDRNGQYNAWKFDKRESLALKSA